MQQRIHAAAHTCSSGKGVSPQHFSQGPSPDHFQPVAGHHTPAVRMRYRLRISGSAHSSFRSVCSQSARTRPAKPSRQATAGASEESRNTTHCGGLTRPRGLLVWKSEQGVTSRCFACSLSAVTIVRKSTLYRSVVRLALDSQLVRLHLTLMRWWAFGRSHMLHTSANNAH